MDTNEIIADLPLHYTHDATAGFTREKKGKNFVYFDTEHKRIKDSTRIERIAKLVIPPAWKEVWICPSPTGHLQATGIDDRGRKQYIYHELWNKACQENKFDAMLEFYELLPDIRDQVRADMRLPALEKRRVIATIVWLLEHTFIRIGNTEYARENNSFGLTTLREKHVDVRGDQIKFEFPGKSGVEHEIEVSDPRVAKTIKKSLELPGYELFRYVDTDKNKHVVDSQEVNEYLQALTGKEITAKYFRTWGGTVLSARLLYNEGPFKSEIEEKTKIRIVVKKVAKHLGNTTKVCRSYYIHPVIITSYEKKRLIPHFEKLKENGKKEKRVSFDEYAVGTLLKKYT